MKVGLFIGNLHEAPADVVFTSTNPALNSIKGADATLRQKGGPELREASRKVLQREQARTGQQQLPAGSVAATGPGALPFQAVVHCVAFDAQGATPDSIVTCLRNAWDTALGLKPRPQSVALPVLAADNGKYEFGGAARLMADTLRDLQDRPIDTVWIVLKDAKNQGPVQRVLEDRFGPVAVRSATANP